MGLIGALIGGGNANTTNNNGNGGANNALNGGGKGADNAASKSPAATPEVSSTTGNSSVGSNLYTYRAEEEAKAQADAAARATGKVELRENEVIAVDFARRAAIAAQAKSMAMSLLESVQTENDETFAPLASKPVDSESAYAKSAPLNGRISDKVEKQA